MRSLTVLTCDVRAIKGKKPEARYTGLAIRPEELEGITSGQGETIYIASERGLPDGGVEVQIFISNASNDYANSPVASFKAPPEPPFELPDGRHIVDFKYLAEINALAAILAGGDIVVVNLEDHLLPGQDKIEVVGSVESGIKAAEWSPDEELLVLITGDDNLVEMTKTFDVLAESMLRTDDFGEDKPVNVGWGAQETQFHGSIGKAGRDAVAGLPAASTLSQPGTSIQPPAASTSFDDQTIRISWRGDGAFFVVSATFCVRQSNEQQRRLRFYSRTAVLQATSEATPGMEGGLAWQPSGSIVAASALNSSQIIFFERNGLRRYEFSLKEERPEYNTVVRGLSWNADSTILAVHLERRGAEDENKRHCVQLWRRNNYHWYLKQTLFRTATTGQSLESVMWHPEKPMSLFVLTSVDVEQRTLAWQTYASNRKVPHDSGTVAVMDGSRILLTPFRYQNIPPPMSSLALQTPDGRTPIHIAFARNADTLVALMPSNEIDVWRWHAKKRTSPTSTHVGRYALDQTAESASARQVSVIADGDNLKVYLLAQDRTSTFDVILELTIPLNSTTSSVKCNKYSRFSEGLTQVCAHNEKVFVQTAAGRVLSLDNDLIATLPESCPTLQVLDEQTILALSESGRLYLNDQMLASGCSSFAIGGDFLIYTTLQHEARFVLLQTLLSANADSEAIMAAGFSQALPKSGQVETIGANAQGDVKTGYARKVERGSRIVTVVPSTMSIILQMPRGNLETISPRPLVLQVVREHLDQKEYREAFLVCRRHRIDLNILCDHNREAFIQDLSLFVDQIDSTEYLGLFVTGLKNENVTRTMYASLSPAQAISQTDDRDKVDTVCKRLRVYLESKDLVKYANAVLTTYACQSPPDLESALRVLTRIKALNQQAADDAVKYIIFLADANTLFDVALGIYDFDLVLAVAQNSQKDPREYIPFLRELKAYDTFYQRFKIDDHLNRFSRALGHLALAGEERFDEALQYMRQHELYDAAVSNYASSSKQLRIVLDLRGDWLMKDNRCHEAALSYLLASQPRKAMVAHQKALTWVELFDIALQEKLSGEEIAQLAERVAEDLRGKARHAEAGRVLLEYGRDVKGAVSVLSEGGLFSEALRLTSLYTMPKLVLDIILPSVHDCREKLSEEAAEIKDQVVKQVTRLHELREKRLSDTANFYGRLLPADGEDALDNVDMQTDAGTAATTAFTRYTAAAASTRAGTVKSGASRRTAKKQMRKAATGAKGSIFEESYLLGSLSRLVAEGGRMATLIASTASLTRASVRLSSIATVEATQGSEESLLREAKQLEDEVAGLLVYVSSSIEEIWTALGDAKVHDLDTALLADADPSQADLELLKKPEKPKTGHFGHWKVGLLSLLNL